jgi:hypothetical protein
LIFKLTHYPLCQSIDVERCDMLKSFLKPLSRITSVVPAMKRMQDRRIAKEIIDKEIARFNRHVEAVMGEIEQMEKNIYLSIRVDKDASIHDREEIKLMLECRILNRIVRDAIEKVKAIIQESE